MSGALLVGRTALLAKLETSFDVPANPTGALDALLIDNCIYDPDFKTLERKFHKPSLSPNPIRVGRKLGKVKFDVEVAGNGLVGASPPRWARLLKGCGMLETLRAAPSSSPVLPVGMPSSPRVSWATSGTLVPTAPVVYIIKVATGGSSGTAKFDITAADPDLDAPQTAVAATSGTAVDVGTKGLKCTPTWTGSLVEGQAWVVALMPAGVTYTPRSSDFESLTLGVYYDGGQHMITGSFGTMTMKANAGEDAKMSFEFTGRHVDYQDAPLPTTIFEDQPLPPIFENAKLNLAGMQPVADAFTFDAGVGLAERSSVNADDGFLGMRIVSRAPRMGLTPEAQTVAEGNLWELAEQGMIAPFSTRIGNSLGNCVHFWTPGAQVTGMPYRDKNGIRNHEMALALSSLTGAGDDEYFIHIC
ncbi:hypothetical protein [Roseococcus pinisoli]|uniref:Uncharacterized protein n=1 Tax=Roseococcus pinisoli TaxID=2835040 RepID=A0ABS5QF74_9PROT|nr:hypothetical protein [Roseococcus pinisoli]MBS7812350.1 hypothetical protein [Roseococcus pinisoli]